MTAVQDKLPQPDPPPPAPTPTAKELRARAKADSKALWQLRYGNAKAKVRGINRGYVITAGVLVVLAFGANSCRNYNLELARIKADDSAPAPTATAEPSVPVYDGMPNPLDSMLLSDQARYIIGERATEDGSRAPMPVMRSAQVIAQIMEMQDLCEVYVQLGEGARPVVLTEPAPMSAPLMHESQCPVKPALPATTTSTSTTVVAAG